MGEWVKQNKLVLSEEDIRKLLLRYPGDFIGPIIKNYLKVNRFIS
jgi:hypothetical protein